MQTRKHYIFPRSWEKINCVFLTAFFVTSIFLEKLICSLIYSISRLLFFQTRKKKHFLIHSNDCSKMCKNMNFTVKKKKGTSCLINGLILNLRHDSGNITFSCKRRIVVLLISFWERLNSASVIFPKNSWVTSAIKRGTN